MLQRQRKSSCWHLEGSQLLSRCPREVLSFLVVGVCAVPCSTSSVPLGASSVCLHKDGTSGAPEQIWDTKGHLLYGDTQWEAVRSCRDNAAQALVWTPELPGSFLPEGGQALCM